jgi:hypothetical protein
MRAADGIPQIDEPGGDDFTRARLDIENARFLGRNAPGVDYDRPSGVTYQAMRHAEGDVFGQAAQAGINGGDADLYVDQVPCDFCRGGMAGLARSVGLDSLRVWTPEGLYGTYESWIGKFLLTEP